jgi:hypothetical protein
VDNCLDLPGPFRAKKAMKKQVEADAKEMERAIDAM